MLCALLRFNYPFPARQDQDIAFRPPSSFGPRLPSKTGRIQEALDGAVPSKISDGPPPRRARGRQQRTVAFNNWR